LVSGLAGASPPARSPIVSCKKLMAGAEWGTVLVTTTRYTP